MICHLAGNFSVASSHLLAVSIHMSLEVFSSRRNDTRLYIWHPHSQIPEARAGILSAPLDCMRGIPGHATCLGTRTRPPRLAPRPVAASGGGPAHPTGSLRKPVTKLKKGGTHLLRPVRPPRKTPQHSKFKMLIVIIKNLIQW